MVSIYVTILIKMIGGLEFESQDRGIFTILKTKIFISIYMSLLEERI